MVKDLAQLQLHFIQTEPTKYYSPGEKWFGASKMENCDVKHQFDAASGVFFATVDDELIPKQFQLFDMLAYTETPIGAVKMPATCHQMVLDPLNCKVAGIFKLKSFFVLRIWEGITGKILGTATGEESGASLSENSNAFFNRSGGVIATGARDTDVCVWDSATCRKLQTLVGSSRCTLVAFSNDDRFVIAICCDNFLVWSYDNANSVMLMIPSLSKGRFLRDIQTNDFGPYLLSVEEGNIGVWNYETGESMLPLTAIASVVECGCFGGTDLCFHSDRYSVKAYNFLTKTLLFAVQLPNIVAMVWTPITHTLVVVEYSEFGSGFSNAFQYNAMTGERVAEHIVAPTLFNCRRPLYYRLSMTILL